MVSRTTRISFASVWLAALPFTGGDWQAVPGSVAIYQGLVAGAGAVRRAWVLVPAPEADALSLVEVECADGRMRVVFDAAVSGGHVFDLPAGGAWFAPEPQTEGEAILAALCAATPVAEGSGTNERAAPRQIS